MKTFAGNELRKSRGFTLVEMAVVLVIIGLILGAVAIGKDIQRNAEYAKIKQKFIDQWAVSYNAYVQRTGFPLGDMQQEPRYMVNGTHYNQGVGPGEIVSGGDMTNQQAPDAICRGAAGPGMERRMEIAQGFDLRDMMQRAGVRMPPGRAEGREDRYVYLDTNGNPQEVQVCFQWNNPTRPEGAGNVMVITGLTPDLARYLDQMIDGKPDAREGLFRQQGVSHDTHNVAGVEWGSNNTVEYSEAGTATGMGRERDEDQVQTVVAIYKMNQ